jgi:hypothetical protein
VESFLHYILFVSPYRCDECDDRHLRFRSGKDVQHSSPDNARHACEPS